MVTMAATKISQQCFKCVKLFIHKIFTLYNVCSVNWGIFSTSGDVQYMGGYHEYIGACSVHWRDTMSTSGEYHEYIEGCSVHQRDIMMRVGEQLDKSFQFLLKTPVYSWYPPMYSWFPWCTEHPLMYSWYPLMYWTSPNELMVSPHMLHDIPNILNIPHCIHDITPPWCTHGIPPMYWTSPNVHMVPSNVLNTSMYSWYSPNVLNNFNVLNTPRCTEYPPMY